MRICADREQHDGDEQEHAHGRGAAHVEELERGLVDEQRQHARRVRRAAAGHDHRHGEHLHRDDHGHHHAPAAWSASSNGRVMSRNIAQRLAPSIFGGFVVFGGDRLQAGEEDHHVVRRGAPDADQDDGRQRGGAAAQPRHGIDAEPAEHRVEHAVLLIHEGPDDGHHHRRHHHRHEHRRPQHVLQEQAAVEQHREAERQRPAPAAR